MERNQFTFYNSFAKAAESVRKKTERCDFYDMVKDYALYGEAPNPERTTRRLMSLFYAAKPTIEKDIRQSVEGRRCAEYKLWRKAVFERDGYTCQMCGARGVKINAHHIKPYAYFPELRYALDNGVTLCEKCHKEAHRRWTNE